VHAVLIGCVVLFCGFKPNNVVAEDIALNQNPKAKFGSVDCLTKNVLVFSPSPYQQRSFTIARTVQVKVDDGNWRRVNALTGADESSEHLGVRFVLKGERFERLLGQVDNVMTDLGDEPSSSGIPGIFPCNPKTPRRDIRDGIIELAQIDAVQEYIGSQLPLGSFVSTLDEFVGRSSETHREETKNNREYRNEHRANRNNFFVMVMNKNPPGVQPDFEDGVRRGAIIFVGMCCFAAFAAFYWWLITR
jgi:hypothetical protein